jgi:methyltransferase-like protein
MQSAHSCPRAIGVIYFRRMAPKKTSLKKIADMLAHVVKHMATKDDIADLRREMATKADIDRLDTKLTKFEEHEIDKRLQLEVRVAAIERHLGLDKKIAA